MNNSQGRESTVKRYEVNGSSSVFEDESGSLVDYQDYAALESKCAALAAKGMELAAEAAVVYGKYNETQMPDRDLVDMQTIQEIHDLCAGVQNAHAFLAEVRAQGVEIAISQAFREGIPVNRMQFISRMMDFAAQLRQGAAQ